MTDKEKQGPRTEKPLTEERVRQIIQEELAKFAKQQQHERRFGLPANAEVK